MNVPKFRMTITRREAIWAYIFISPWIIGFFIFTLGPMIASLYFSFTDYNIVSPPVWTGITNFRKILFDDPLFWHSLKVTIKFVGGFYDCSVIEPKNSRG
jgi:multiple sugar transport system permease protein